MIHEADEGSLKRIHVNVNSIRHNAKVLREQGKASRSELLPVCRLQDGSKAIYGDHIDIVHEGIVVASLVYRPHAPLPCGAKVWIETTQMATVFNVREHQDSCVI